MFDLRNYFNTLSGRGRTQFAKRAGVALPTLQRHYIYRTRIPRLNRMRAMADAAGVPAAEMVEFFMPPRND